MLKMKPDKERFVSGTALYSTKLLRYNEWPCILYTIFQAMSLAQTLDMIHKHT